MAEDQNLREQIVEFGRKLYERGYVVAADGNLSTRFGDGLILTTPSGLCKGELEPDQLLVSTRREMSSRASWRPAASCSCTWRSTASGRMWRRLYTRTPR